MQFPLYHAWLCRCIVGNREQSSQLIKVSAVVRVRVHPSRTEQLWCSDDERRAQTPVKLEPVREDSGVSAAGAAAVYQPLMAVRVSVHDRHYLERLPKPLLCDISSYLDTPSLKALSHANPRILGPATFHHRLARLLDSRRNCARNLRPEGRACVHNLIFECSHLFEALNPPTNNPSFLNVCAQSVTLDEFLGFYGAKRQEDSDNMKLCNQQHEANVPSLQSSCILQSSRWNGFRFADVILTSRIAGTGCHFLSWEEFPGEIEYIRKNIWPKLAKNTDIDYMHFLDPEYCRRRDSWVSRSLDIAAGRSELAEALSLKLVLRKTWYINGTWLPPDTWCVQESVGLERYYGERAAPDEQVSVLLFVYKNVRVVCACFCCVGCHLDF